MIFSYKKSKNSLQGIKVEMISLSKMKIEFFSLQQPLKFRYILSSFYCIPMRNMSRVLHTFLILFKFYSNSSLKLLQ